jgi:hypothetical protein
MMLSLWCKPAEQSAHVEHRNERRIPLDGHGAVERSNLAVKNRRLFGRKAAISLVRVTLPPLIAFWLTTVSVAPALARAWSFHYKPEAPNPPPTAGAAEASIMQGTPAPEQLSTAPLLKRAIVSDLALLIQEQGARSDKEYPVHQLLSFDQLSSPEALGVFASLSGYYLGARGEELYDCLSLRKGKGLEPYLEQYLHNGNAECSQQLGQTFTTPSSALGGYPLCPDGRQQKAHLTTLIAELDSARTCSDSDLAAVAARLRLSLGERQ